ncbi:uncharacterized protein J7T54_007144 [Emericellopsis cladophorae]|uniref:Major facilitator superfamily (MFS) profile domain-containing protein n=1 Tax=Emericellopsis cladophorae TaxID=2686198 RepID=A0A9P9Y8N2_9HYPO|nr:uncharacterized protein J7T54_007144 [Emericellopsis cladophorae]KAI6785501.1 hypothetical protein J7T54_007144 [Emericellopsis cladophorae]
MAVPKSLAWIYQESGIAAVYTTGRDAWLLILSRTIRMFAFGAVSLTIALFFSELGFSDFRIGLFLTLTLLGDVVLGTLIALMADSIGRRRVLLAGGILMAVSGLVFMYFENFWVLLIAAVVGVVSASGSDFGPFRAIEESMLSHITTPQTRPYVLSWYITGSALGSAAGTQTAGQFVEALKSKGMVQIYHATFGIYVITGFMNMVLAFLMSSKCETERQDLVPEHVDELAQGLLEDSDSDDERVGLDTTMNTRRTPVAQQPPSSSNWTSKFAQISVPTRNTMYKLWFLLCIDTLADGMCNQTLTNYYLDRKFEIPKTTLGNIVSAGMILGTVGTLFAGPLAHHLGLLNTMVFTHLPSSIAVALFPAPSSLAITVILLIVRMGLNPVDQAPRSAFIAAAVKPEERTAVMGITSTLRTLAMAVGPSLTGMLAGSNKFWIAFVVGGMLRIMYDLGLYAIFVNVELHAHETAKDTPTRVSLDDEEEAVEMQSHPRWNEGR